MARSIQDLPDEISIQILGYLDTSSLKNARLTSPKWARAGCRWLFRRIFFAPHKAIMAIFSKITHEPAFAVGVEELVYDARLFWPDMTELDAYATIYRRELRYRNRASQDLQHLPGVVHRLQASLFSFFLKSKQRAPDDETTIKKSHQQYLMLLKEQYDITRDEGDFRALCGGLQRLPNLRRITIFPCKESAYLPPTGSITVRNVMSNWYSKWSSQFWHDAIPPSSRSDFYDGGPDHWMNPEQGLNDVLLSLQKWDKRGLSSFARAICTHGPVIKHLRFFSSFLPAKLLRDPEVTASLQSIALNLRYLEVDYEVFHYNVTTDEAVEEGVFGLRRLMHQATQLEDVSLNTFTLESCTRGIFEDVYWPCLVRLSLSNIQFESSLLTGMCHRHRATLRQLKLEDITLRHSARMKDLAANLGTFLRLEKVTLINFANLEGVQRQLGDALINYDKLIELCGLMMRWVPEHMLKMKQEYHKVSMWVESGELSHTEASNGHVASNRFSILAL